MTAVRATAVTAAACATVFAAALPSSAINSYNATPAPERTEVGALVATWNDDGDPATPDRWRSTRRRRAAALWCR
ncbi:hypothetical protein ACWDFR_42645 [Streptomyces sp. 900105755]